MKKVKPRRPDFILSIPVVILVGFGMVMVYSASGVQSLEIYNDAGVIFFKQLVALFLGLIGMIVAIITPHQIYRKKPILLLALGIVLTLLVGVIFQFEAKGAHRWYYIGRFGFQPSDLAKIVIIMFVAAVATGFQDHVKPWKARIIAIGCVVVIFCGLILSQPDFGTTMIILGIAGMMLFLAGMPLRFLALGGLLLLPLMAGLLATKPYRIQRLKDFVFQDHYQTRQAKLAIGSGGMTGTGLGKGKQKLYYLPEPHTDFIYATLCEEFGFMGAMTILACYLFFLFRGAHVLSRVESEHSRVLGAGLLMLLTIQAFINISITVDLFPNKGLTLPFISAGGTSLALSLTMFGIILNISRWQIMENRVAL